MAAGKNNNTILNRIDDKTFGDLEQFIITKDNALPTDRLLLFAIVLEDVTGFSAENDYLITGSGSYPTFLYAGTELPSGLKNVTVTGGTILGVLK